MRINQAGFVHTRPASLATSKKKNNVALPSFLLATLKQGREPKWGRSSGTLVISLAPKTSWWPTTFSLFRVDLVDDVDKLHDRSGSNPPPPLGRPGGGAGAQPGREFQNKEKKKSEEGTAKKKLGQMQPACFKALVLFLSSSCRCPPVPRSADYILRAV